MVKRPNYSGSDTADDDFFDPDVKTPKKVKRETKQEPGDESPTKVKRQRATGTARNAWTKEEEMELLDCIQEVLTNGMSSVVKSYPKLAARGTFGCLAHWYSWRRKHDIALVGAPTINSNGKKLSELTSPKKEEPKKEELMKDE